MPLIRVNNLTVTLNTPNGSIYAVRGVSFVLAAGKTLALVGESGCGKSITALSLMRLLPESTEKGNQITGEILYADQNLLIWPEYHMRALRGRKMAMIFQEPMLSLNPVLKIKTQLFESFPETLQKEAYWEQALALLKDVGITEGVRVLESYPFELSGGMRQRVMIAMALAGQPEVIIADEPTTALDVTTQAQILTLLQTLQEKYRLALLLITHDLGVVAQLADDVALMYAGEIVEYTDKKTFFLTPKHPYARKLFASLPEKNNPAYPLPVLTGTVPVLTQVPSGCAFAPRCEQKQRECEKVTPKLVVIDTTQHVACHVYASRHDNVSSQMVTTPVVIQATEDTTQKIIISKQTKPLLAVQNLSVCFQNKEKQKIEVVKSVSFEIYPHETLALVGESGSGKTTIGRAILNLIRTRTGSITFSGKQIQVIFQDPYASLNPRLRIREILSEGLKAQRLVRSKSDCETQCETLLAQVGLEKSALNRFPHEFSGGQRQRIAIARALSVQPDLIICDEAVSALDVSVQAQILNLLSDLQQKTGVSYLFITHNLNVVRYLAHRVAVLYQGQIVEYTQTDQLFAAPQTAYTQQLLAAIPESTVALESKSSHY